MHPCDMTHPDWSVVTQSCHTLFLWYSVFTVLLLLPNFCRTSGIGVCVTAMLNSHSVILCIYYLITSPQLFPQLVAHWRVWLCLTLLYNTLYLLFRYCSLTFPTHTCSGIDVDEYDSATDEGYDYKYGKQKRENEVKKERRKWNVLFL